MPTSRVSIHILHGYTKHTFKRQVVYIILFMNIICSTFNDVCTLLLL